MKIYYTPYDKQNLVHNSKAKNRIVCYARRAGKALDLNTPIPIPTEDLYTTMGELKVGDKVFDEKGKICTVTFVTETMYDHNCYKVTFCDGSEIIADEEHRWLVSSHYIRQEKSRFKNKNKQIKDVVKTTKELKEKLCYDKRGNKNWQIQMAKAVKMPEQELLIPPYIMGLWLGDGSSICNSITCDNEDYDDYVEFFIKDGENVGKKRKDSHDNNTHNFTFGMIKNYQHGKKRKYTIKDDFRAMNLIRNKHIPKEYLFNSIENRKLLLQGLLDSDGSICVNKKNSICLEFIQKSEEISKGMKYLLSSLGIKFTVTNKKTSCNGKYCGIAYRFNIKMPEFCPFRLKRKAKIYNDYVKSGKKRRKNTLIIKNIEKVDSVPVRCITVDSPNHLYLCGERFIPTHNTMLACAEVIRRMQTSKRPLKIGWITPSHQICERGFDTMKAMCRELIDAKVMKVKNSIPFKLTFNDHTLFYLSTQKADLMLGFGFDFIVLDEAAIIENEDYEKVVRPFLLDTDGDMLAISTPRGKNNFFYKLFKLGEEPNKLYESFHATGYDNPYVSDESIDAEKATMPSALFRQEYLAEFIDAERTVFEDVSNCFCDLECKCESKKVMGADLARKADDTCLISLCPKCGIITNMQIYEHVPWPEQESKIKAFYKKNDCCLLYIDGTGLGDVVQQYLQQTDLKIEPVIFSAGNKFKMYNDMISAVENSKIKFNNEKYPDIEKQLLSLEREVKKTTVSYNAASGGKDDVCDALCLALKGFIGRTELIYFECGESDQVLSDEELWHDLDDDEWGEVDDFEEYY